MAWKKGKVAGTIITSPQEAPEPPSISTVEVYGGFVLAIGVHPDAIDFFINSKELFACAQAALSYLKRHPGGTAPDQSENIALQRQMIRAIASVPPRYSDAELYAKQMENSTLAEKVEAATLLKKIEASERKIEAATKKAKALEEATDAELPSTKEIEVTYLEKEGHVYASIPSNESTDKEESTDAELPPH